ncbi:MAG: TonB-dependent receptor [Gammaproteobacteria bacterium]|nr:TonB-dependent receptor [Gammaproteobacteria bacterium]MDE0243738.1 TonB-dependent receptor [Gammaproteobacteria bacterium]MDE0415182.1 TonB-dependent receptor [Gammaproteobacteria bacterium]
MRTRIHGRWLAAFLLVFLAPAVGFAQDDDSQATTDEEALELGEQIVTGTRLPTAAGASPIFVLTRAEIDRRGLTSIEDIVRYLPQNFSTITNGGSLDNRSPRFQIGSVTINLRGLGEGSTLVLVNGRRLAASPAENGTFTDVSTLPFSAIERVEVMTDGASAVYGSDAVGGVVNFIMKKNYRGSESSIRYENSSSGGHRRVVEQTFGLSWDTGNVTASASYREEDPVFMRDAGLDTDGDYRDQGGRFYPNTFGQPGNILRFGLPSGAPPNTTYGILPAGDGTNFSPDDVIYVSNEEVATQSGNFNLLQKGLAATAPGEAIPYSEHLSAYLSLTQEIGENLTLSLSGTYARQDSIQEGVGASFSGPVPASNYYNPFGEPVYIAYAFHREIADGKLSGFARTTDLDRINVSTSLTWETPIEGWTAVFSANYGKDNPYGGYPGSFQYSARQGPAGAAFEAALASSDPAEAINPFGDGTVQRATLEEFVTYATRGAREGRQDVIGLSLSGSLLELTGGPVELALGAEARTDTLDFDSFLLNPFTFRVPDAPEIVPESENTAWFAELSVPLVGDSNSRPGIHGLILYAAGRYDEYEIEGPFEGILAPASTRKFDDFVTKLGVVYRPVESLKLRATWGQAFLAATLPELFGPKREFTFFRFLDPLNPVENGGPFASIFPLTVLGGNPDLQPQTSDTATLGFEYTPADIPGLYLSLTWSKTDYEGLIGSLSSAFGWPPVYAFENWQQFPNQIRRDAEGVLTYVSMQSTNLSARTSEALDFEARYTFDTTLGEFAAGILGTRTLALEIVSGPGVDPVQQAGTNQGPVDLKGSAYVDWSLGPWGANLTINHASSYENINTGVSRTDVDGYTTVDLQGSYVLSESGWRFTAGVQNIFDADFPFFDSYRGVDSAQIDFRRRIAFVDVVKEFSW